MSRRSTVMELVERGEGRSDGGDPAGRADATDAGPAARYESPRRRLRGGVTAALAVLGAVAVGWGGFEALQRSEALPWQRSEAALNAAVENRLAETRAELLERLEATAQASEEGMTIALDKIRTEYRSALSSAVAPLSRELAALGHRLDQVDARLTAHDAEITAIETRLATLPEDLGQARTVVRRMIERYDRKWRELAEDATGLEASGISRPPPSEIPFAITSIDLWDGAPQVVVQHDGRRRFLNVGDRLDGWRVAALDYRAQQATLIDPYGRTRQFSRGAETQGGGALMGTPASSANHEPTLTVVAEPDDARIRIMNIVPKYRPRMAVEPGAYDILVEKAGYTPYRRWIRVADHDRVLKVRLRR